MNLLQLNSMQLIKLLQQNFCQSNFCQSNFCQSNFFQSNFFQSNFFQSNFFQSNFFQSNVPDLNILSLFQLQGQIEREKKLKIIKSFFVTAPSKETQQQPSCTFGVQISLFLFFLKFVQFLVFQFFAIILLTKKYNNFIFYPLKLIHAGDRP